MAKSECLIFLFLFFRLSSAENPVDPETQKKRVECIEKCGGGSYLRDVFDRSDLLCVSNWLGHKFETHPPCLLECMGIKADEDQQKCLIDYCMEGSNANFFCTSESKAPISRKQCNLLASGEVKFSPNCQHRRDLRLTECMEKCGGFEHNREMWANGHALCFPSETTAAAGTLCISDCIPVRPHHNQLECWYKYCKIPRGTGQSSSPSNHSFRFCREPKGKRIKWNECSLVIKEEVKMYGNCS